MVSTTSSTGKPGDGAACVLCQHTTQTWGVPEEAEATGDSHRPGRRTLINQELCTPRLSVPACSPPECPCVLESRLLGVKQQAGLGARRCTWLQAEGLADSATAQEHPGRQRQAGTASLRL